MDATGKKNPEEKKGEERGWAENCFGEELQEKKAPLKALQEGVRRR